MIKALNTWTFHRDTPIKQMAGECAQAGFDGIELAVNPDGEFNPQTAEDDCRHLADVVRDHGLTITSLACGLYLERNFADPDPAIRQSAEELTVALLDRAVWTEAPCVTLIPAVVGRQDSPDLLVGYEDAFHRTYASLRKLAAEAERRAVTLTIETVWNRFLMSPLEMRQLIDAVNSPCVGVCADVANILAYGYPQDWIRILAHRVRTVHFKDFKLVPGSRTSFCPIGDGDVDFTQVMAALRETDYQGPLIVEGAGDPADHFSRLCDVMNSD